MRRVNIRGLAIVALGVVVVAAGSTLFASNMGFKLNSLLRGSDTSAGGGRTILSLPFNRQLGLDNAAQVAGDIDAAFGGDTVLSVARYNTTADGFETYDPEGVDPTGFPLMFAEALFIQVQFDTNYIVVGSHKPGQAITFLGASSSAGSGRILYSHAYHSTKATAAELSDEIDAQFGGETVLSVARYNTTADGFETYDPEGVDPAGFPLTPGEGLFIQVDQDVTWTPSHY